MTKRIKMRSHYCGELSPESDGEQVKVCGWVHEIRNMGKLKFVILRDKTGFLQVTAKKGNSPEEVLNAIDDISRESVVGFTGTLIKSPKAPGGIELKPEQARMINQSLTPLPLDVTEKVDADMDTRLNNRFLDIRKPRISSIFLLRSSIISAGRNYLKEKGFTEINSPKIIASASEGGTELFPISYFDKEAFLAQSPQLYKQMMMATGLDRVCELTTYFRAEEHDTRRHLNEITAFDCEMAFINNEDEVMDLLEGLMLSMIRGASEQTSLLKTLGKDVNVPESIPRVSYDEVLELLDKNSKRVKWGEDLDTESERTLGEAMKKEYDSELYFIKNFPLEIKPFYTMHADDIKYSRAFDLGYKGVEVSSGGQRIHDPTLLKDQISKKGLNPENFGYYLDAFNYGMPPHGGFGLGIDRVMMQLLELPIREVVLFPRDRHRLTP